MKQVENISFRERIAALSDAQKLLLAQRLNLPAQQSGSFDSLAAFIVPTNIADVAAIKEQLTHRLPDYMQPDIVLIDNMPRTPNGKINRNALLEIPKSKLDNGSETTGLSAAQVTLRDIWKTVLAVDAVSINDNFFELGGDSIRAMQVISRARSAGIDISVRQLFAQPTIAQLITSEPALQKVETMKSVSGDVLLSPIQRWFFRENFAESHHWNQSALLTLHSENSAAELSEALQTIVKHHEAFRIHFEENDKEWWQIASAQLTELPFKECVHPGEGKLEAFIRQAQLELDYRMPGKAWQAIYLDGQEKRPSLLLLVMHHLLIDGVSWAIVLEDLSEAIEGKRQGRTPVPLSTSTTLPEWNERLQQFANQRETYLQVAQWLHCFEETSGQIPRKENADLQKNTEGNSKTVMLELSREDTALLLGDCTSAYRASLNEFLLSTLFASLTDWSGNTKLKINMEGHGREEAVGADASRAVGWFTSFFPITTAFHADAEINDILTGVKNALNDIPENGIAVAAAQYLGQSEKLRSAIDKAMKNDVLYNYLGTLDGDYGNHWDYKLISSRSPKAHRSHLLDVTAYILKDCLQLHWEFCPDLHDEEVIRKQAEQQLNYLQTIIENRHAASTNYTPADFPLAGLDQHGLQQLGELLKDLDSRGEDK
ncbi:MAG: condensation domain-containing protein [Calditrichia bacterium]